MARTRPPERVELSSLLVPVECGDGFDQRIQRGLRILGGARVSGSDAGDDRFDPLALAVELLARRDQDQLRIGGSAEIVDAELARRHSDPAQRHALGVPEGRRRVDPAGGERRDRLEADRRRLRGDRQRRPASRGPRQDGVVGGQPGDPDRRAEQVGRRPDLLAVAGDHGCQGYAGRWRRRRPGRLPARGRSPRSLMSMIARSARPAASSFGASVEAPGCWTSSATRAVPARRHSAPHRSRSGRRSAGSPGQGSRARQPRARPVQRRPPQPAERQHREGGRQRRGDPTHLSGAG